MCYIIQIIMFKLFIKRSQHLYGWQFITLFSNGYKALNNNYLLRKDLMDIFQIEIYVLI